MAKTETELFAEANDNMSSLIHIVETKDAEIDRRVAAKEKEVDNFIKKAIKLTTKTYRDVKVKKDTPVLICNIADFGLDRGKTYQITIIWSGDGIHYWFGGLGGSFYLYNDTNFNGCPPTFLELNGTVHHRNGRLPIFSIDGCGEHIGNKESYSHLGIFVNAYYTGSIGNITIKIKEIGA